VGLGGIEIRRYSLRNDSFSHTSIHPSLQTSAKAFTLAEVLVTLMIIGVIAAMTIPALRKSAEQKEMIAGMKKAYSSLNQMVSMSEIDNGSLRRWNITTNEAFIQEYILPYLNISKDCGKNAACFGPEIKHFNGSPYSENIYYIKLTDGTRWMFVNQDTVHFHVFADINGDKKPNRFGNDTFLFTVIRSALNDGAHLVSEPGVYYYGHGLVDRNYLSSECTTNGYTCAALIVLDGDKINY
jgi:prepilin-type N-terminal cleavage/methylation domain-containing protein